MPQRVLLPTLLFLMEHKRANPLNSLYLLSKIYFSFVYSDSSIEFATGSPRIRKATASRTTRIPKEEGTASPIANVENVAEHIIFTPF